MRSNGCRRSSEAKTGGSALWPWPFSFFFHAKRVAMYMPQSPTTLPSCLVTPYIHSPIRFHFVKSSPSLTARPMHPNAAPSEVDSVNPT